MRYFVPFILLACVDGKFNPEEVLQNLNEETRDADQDGFFASEDCDDSTIVVSPAASETTTEHVNTSLPRGRFGEIETEEICGAEFRMSTDASSQLPSTYPSFGVTRTDHVSFFAVSDDGSVLPVCKTVA